MQKADNTKATGHVMFSTLSTIVVRPCLTILRTLSLSILLIGSVLADATAIADLARFDIDQQPLKSALTEFAWQSDREILFSTDIVAGKQASMVAGVYEPEEALGLLLTDTGLEYSITSNNTILVNEKGDDASSRNLMVQNIGGEAPTTASSRPGEQDATSVVTGKVTDARTGANLKGALVTIDETNQSTATDDLGRYRFPAIREGKYTLRVSYLGYAGAATVLQVVGPVVSRDLTLMSGTEIEEIVVLGQRSARATALNLERTAPNSTTVLSADVLGQFNGTTVSEALRRAPGVAFVPDEVTGDGAQVIVRGLEPDLNQVNLNGLRLLDGTGLGRSPDLSGILTESIESVTINKSLLPSQESNGAGALIEIETKGPLDRGKRFASFNAEYGASGGDFREEYGVGGTVSSTFGNDDSIGISLSGGYRERDNIRLTYDQSSSVPELEVLPETTLAGDAVTQKFDLDPRRRFPFEPGFGNVYPGGLLVNQGASEQETLSLIGSIQKQFGASTSIRFDAVYTEDVITSYNTATSFSSNTNYDAAPVDSLGGELREVLVSEDIGRNDPNPFFPVVFGTGIPGFVFRNVSLDPDQESKTLSINLRGDTAIERWQFSYGLGFSEAENEAPGGYALNLSSQSLGVTGFLPELIDRNFLSDEALSNVTGDGRIISVFPRFESGADGRFLLPLFNSAGFAFYNDLDNFPLFLDVLGPRTSEGEEFDLNISARRTFSNNILEYIEGGLLYRESSFFSPGDVGSESAADLGKRSFSKASDALSSELGLAFARGLLTQVGAQNDLSSLDRASVESLISNIPALIQQGLLVEGSLDGPDNETLRDTSEDSLAAYFEAKLNIGKFDLTGGLRLERIEVGARSLSSPRVIGVDGRTILLDPEEFGAIETDSATQTEVMPRVLANYRFSENMLLRAAYYTTVSRPQLSNVTSRRELILRLDPSESTTGDRPVLEIREGNPELRPARTHNFALDWEWYTSDIGVLKAGVFYKVIDDPLQRNRVIGGTDVLPTDVSLPDIPFFNDLPDPVEINLIKPKNSEDSDRIWGLELTVERQFPFLPGALSGLGAYVNYAYTDSESTQRLNINTEIDPRGFVEIEDVPFEGSPEHQGTFGFTYTKYNIDGSLLYSRQSRRFRSLSSFGFDIYDEAVETLDLRVDYLLGLGGKVRLFVRGEDLLSSRDDAFLQTSIGGEGSVPQYYTGGTYFGGRQVFGGVSVSF